MNGEKGPLVTNEAVEVQDFRKIIDHSRETYTIYMGLVKKIGRCQCVIGWTWKHYDLD